MCVCEGVCVCVCVCEGVCVCMYMYTHIPRQLDIVHTCMMIQLITLLIPTKQCPNRPPPLLQCAPSVRSGWWAGTLSWRAEWRCV